MSLRFFSGLGTIGGTQVLLRADDAGLVFDLGLPYEPAAGLFSEWFVRPRPGREVEDYLRAALAPPIRGLFRGDPIPPGIPAVDDVRELAAFVSHADPDHMALLPYVAPSVPVYMTEATRRTVLALGIDGLRLCPVAPGEAFTVGPIHVVVHPIDHGVQGAAAFVARVGRLRVAYTGDWRWHGAHPETIDAFVAACTADGSPDVLLVDGTRAGPMPDRGGDVAEEVPEAALPQRLDAVLSQARGFVFYAFFPRNVLNASRFLEAFHRAGRIPVFRPDTVRFMKAYGLPFDGLQLDGEAAVLATVAANPAAYVVEAQLADFPLLGELLARAGHRPADPGPPGHSPGIARDDTAGLYLHCGGIPLGPFDPAWPVLERWLRWLRLTYVPLASWGHAAPEDIHRLVKAVAPRILVPVHARHPEAVGPPGFAPFLYRPGDDLVLS